MAVELRACSILSQRTKNTAIVPVSTPIERGTKIKSHLVQSDGLTLQDNLMDKERKRVNNFANSLFKLDANVTC